jgi:hypothetical protein
MGRGALFEQQESVATPQPSGQSRVTKFAAREKLNSLTKQGLIDEESARRFLKDLRLRRETPEQFMQMAETLERFYAGAIGRTYSKGLMQSAVWLGYFAGSGGSAGEPRVRGTQGVLGYLEGLERVFKEREALFDPRGEEGFRTYYLSRGVPPIFRMIEEQPSSTEALPHLLALKLSLPEGGWLKRLSNGPLVETLPGDCVTAVLKTMEAARIPNPLETGKDIGNNPRGLGAQLVQDFGYRSLNPFGSAEEVTLNSSYGSFKVHVLSPNDFIKAVFLGKVPLGAVVLQSKHADIDGTSSASTGFDAAILRGNPLPFLWNGSRNSLKIYKEATRSVIILVPGDYGVTHNEPVFQASQGLSDSPKGSPTPRIPTPAILAPEVATDARKRDP